MAKRKTLYELAKTYYDFRTRLRALAHTPADHFAKDKEYFRRSTVRTDAVLYAEAAARSDGDGALLPALVLQVRAETLNEFEKKLRACGGGHIEALEIVATMKGEVR